LSSRSVAENEFFRYTMVGIVEYRSRRRGENSRRVCAREYRVQIELDGVASRLKRDATQNHFCRAPHNLNRAFPFPIHVNNLLIIAVLMQGQKNQLLARSTGFIVLTTSLKLASI